MKNNKVLKSRGLFYTVPIFMVLIFLVQLILAHWAHLSPWKGGGFGMFSSIDSPAMRVVHAEGEDMDGKPVRIRISFSGLGEKGPLTYGLGRYIRTFPTESTLEEIANHMMEGEYVRYDKPEKIPEPYQDYFHQQPFYRLKYPYESSDESVRLRKLNVSVYRLCYDLSSQKISYQPVLGPVKRVRE